MGPTQGLFAGRECKLAVLTRTLIGRSARPKEYLLKPLGGASGHCRFGYRRNHICFPFGEHAD
jgi:hypothetical protein